MTSPFVFEITSGEGIAICGVYSINLYKPRRLLQSLSWIGSETPLPPGAVATLARRVPLELIAHSLSRPRRKLGYVDATVLSHQLLGLTEIWPEGNPFDPHPPDLAEARRRSTTCGPVPRPTGSRSVSLIAGWSSVALGAALRPKQARSNEITPLDVFT